MNRVANNKGVFIIYGVSDCPSCLMACALAMENYPNSEYIFVNMDFGESFREQIKKKYTFNTYPIIIFEENGCETLIGGYDQLVSFLTNNKQLCDISSRDSNKNKEPT